MYFQGGTILRIQFLIYDGHIIDCWFQIEADVNDSVFIAYRVFITDLTVTDTRFLFTLMYEQAFCMLIFMRFW